jgi:hypothetical protein
LKEKGNVEVDFFWIVRLLVWWLGISHNIVIDLLDNVSTLKISVAIFHDATKSDTEFEMIGNIVQKEDLQKMVFIVISFDF